ncbi:hypothetical protein HON22_04140, partial [Candidatus Peregrinibacteria bacterium]|nr:hypothetical protein [Candidatus Peregrinibacteria bacterium]
NERGKDIVSKDDIKTIIEKLTSPGDNSVKFDGSDLKTADFITFLAHLKRQFNIDPTSIINHKGVQAVDKNQDQKSFQKQVIAQSLFSKIDLSSIEWGNIQLNGNAKYLNDISFVNEGKTTPEHFNAYLEQGKLAPEAHSIGHILALSGEKGGTMDVKKMQQYIQTLKTEFGVNGSKKAELATFQENKEKINELKDTIFKSPLFTENINIQNSEQITRMATNCTTLLKIFEASSEKPYKEIHEALTKKQDALKEIQEAVSKYKKNQKEISGLTIADQLDMKMLKERIQIESNSERIGEDSWNLVAHFKKWINTEDHREYQVRKDSHGEMMQLIQKASILIAVRKNKNPNYKEANDIQEIAKLLGIHYAKYNIEESNKPATTEPTWLKKALNKIQGKEAPKNNKESIQKRMEGILEATVKRDEALLSITKNVVQFSSAELNANDMLSAAASSKNYIKEGSDISRMRQAELMQGMTKDKQQSEALESFLSADGDNAEKWHTAIKNHISETSSGSTSAQEIQKVITEYQQSKSKGGISQWWGGLSSGMKFAMIAGLAAIGFSNKKLAAGLGIGAVATMVLTKETDPLKAIDNITNWTGGKLNQVGAYLGLSNQSRWNGVPENIQPNNKEDVAITLLQSSDLQNFYEPLHEPSIRSAINDNALEDISKHPQLKRRIQVMLGENFKNLRGLDLSMQDMASAIQKVLLIRAYRGGESGAVSGLDMISKDMQTYGYKDGEKSISIKFGQWLDTKVTKYEDIGNEITNAAVALKHWGIDSGSQLGKWISEKWKGTKELAGAAWDKTTGAFKIPGENGTPDQYFWEPGWKSFNPRNEGLITLGKKIWGAGNDGIKDARLSVFIGGIAKPVVFNTPKEIADYTNSFQDPEYKFMNPITVSTTENTKRKVLQKVEPLLTEKHGEFKNILYRGFNGLPEDFKSNIHYLVNWIPGTELPEAAIETIINGDAGPAEDNKYLALSNLIHSMQERHVKRMINEEIKEKKIKEY